jgi:hypothetical protein
MVHVADRRACELAERDESLSIAAGGSLQPFHERGPPILTGRSRSSCQASNMPA